MLTRKSAAVGSLATRVGCFLYIVLCIEYNGYNFVSVFYETVFVGLILVVCLNPCTVVPRPLSNDPRFTQCIYRYSRASKRFVEVYMYVFF